MIKRNPKKQYVVGLDYNPTQQNRLKRFVSAATDCRSVRRFIVEAIENEIQRRLATMEKPMRNSVEEIITGSSRK